MRAFALVSVSLLILASRCVGGEQRYSLAPDLPGIVQFSYSWTPLPLLPARFQNHCGYFNGQYLCANHCGPNYQIYFLLRSVVRLLPHWTWILQRWRFSPLQPKFVSIQLNRDLTRPR